MHATRAAACVRAPASARCQASVIPRCPARSAACKARSSPQQPAQQGLARGAVACHAVKFDAELQALLEGAMARSSCTVGDRVGIMGLKFVEEGRKEGCPVIESAIRLGCYLRDYQHKAIRGRTFLELGSGIGVAGLTAAAFGATVLLTDLPAVVPVAAKNVEKNADLVRGAGGMAEVASLDWERPAAELVAGPWDYVIGADLVYDDRSPDVLAPLLARLLEASPRARVLLAHVHRSAELDDQMTAVFAQHGLEICLAPRDGQQDPHEEDVSILAVQKA